MTPMPLKVEKRKTTTKSVSLIHEKMTTTGVSTIPKNQIAIIYAQGEIQSGEGDVNTIEKVRCVVLCRTQETKMLKLLYFVLTARRKHYIRFN
jgi:hypothetical protein